MNDDHASATLPFQLGGAKRLAERRRIATWLREAADMIESDGAEVEPRRAVLILMGDDDNDVAGPDGTRRADIVDAAMAISRRLQR